MEQKILLLLGTGLVLSLTRNPFKYFRIVKSASREWEKINRRSLQEAIKGLYRSKLIGGKENEDGTISLTLSEKGKTRLLRYRLDQMEIKKPSRWDGLWRMVIFDIPEDLKRGRDALAAKLKKLGFHPMQKSVFIYPYECRDEIDFIIEVFDLRSYVRFVVAKETDIDLDLKTKFKMS